MMDLAHFFSVCPVGIYRFTTKKLSQMYSCMISNRAAERIRRIEEISSQYMKDGPRKKLIDGLFKQMDDKYKDPHMVSEDELKRIFGNAADSIQLVIDYKNGNIKVVSREAENELGKAGDRGGKKFSSNFNSASQSVLRNLKRIGIAAAALGTVTLFKSIREAAALEKIEVQFETLLKSSSLAQKQIEELQDFAANTPFQLEGLATASTQLISFGVAQQDVIPALKQLGDVASGAGANLSELIIPFGRLVSTQRLTLLELDKFADRGINLFGQLAKQTGRSLATIREDVSRGVIPFEEFTKALNILTSEGGLFFESTQKQSRTLSGVLSTLGDNFSRVSASIGQAFSPFIVAGATKLIEALQFLNTQVTKNFNVFTDIIEPLAKFNESFITFVIAPFEQLKNVGSVVFDTIALGFNSLVEGAQVAGLEINKLLNSIGLGSDKAVKASEERLKILASTSEELAGSLNKSLSDIGNFEISNTLSQKNQELRDFFAEQNAIADQQVIDQNSKTEGVLNTAAAQSQTFGEFILGIFDNIRVGVKLTQDQIQKVAKQAVTIVQQGLSKGIAGGIQNIVTSLANGENAFANFGKFLLSTFGDLAIQLGTFFIAQGIAAQKLLAVNPPAATIAAGAALVAVGSLLKAFAGGGVSGGGVPSGGAGGGITGPPDVPSDETLDDDLETRSPTTSVVFNIDGNVKGDEEFIRDTVASIGEEAGKQGLVFENFQTA